MKLMHIHNSVVAQNVARFKDAPARTSYTVLVDRMSGEMRFAKTIRELSRHWKQGEPTAHAQWQEVRLIRREGHLDIEANRSALDPTAWKVAQETLSILNGAKGDESIRDVLGWMGNLSRHEAAQALKGRKEGTYLLREADEIAKAAAFHLTENNGFSARPYLLTFNDKEGKVTDLLLLETPYGWTMYKDDPDLKKAVYHHSPTLLIESFPPARQPIS